MIKTLEEELREFICMKTGKFSSEIEFHLSNLPKVFWLVRSNKNKKGEILVSYEDLKFSLEGGYVSADTGDNVIFLTCTLTYVDKESTYTNRIICRCKYLFYDSDGIVRWDHDGLDIKTAIISILSALQMNEMQIIEGPTEI
jgi:hypothetical protein